MKLLELKYQCLDYFYGSIDRMIVINRFLSYEKSFEEVFVYDFPKLSDLEKAVWCFTMIIRFSRSGMILVKNGSLEKNTLKSLSFLKNENWDNLELSADDKEELKSDILEVTSYLKWLEEKRN